MSDFYDKDKIKDKTCNIVITRYGYGKTLYQLEKANKEIERLKEEVKEWKHNATRINEDNNKLHHIIKEVIEYIQNCGCDDKAIDYIENILDKVEDKE